MIHFIGNLETIRMPNCDGLCSERTCDKEASHFNKIEDSSSGSTFYLPICYEHALELGLQ